MDETEIQYSGFIFISDGAQEHSGETVFCFREQKDIGQLFYCHYYLLLLLLKLRLWENEIIRQEENAHYSDCTMDCRDKQTQQSCV